VTLINREHNVDVPIQTLFDPDALKKLTSCSDIEDVSNVVKNKTDSGMKVDWKAEMVLGDLGALPQPPKKPHRMAALLTGANGFLGVYLLNEILERGKFSEIYCLVRGKDDAEASKRLSDALKKFKLDDLIGNSKIIAVPPFFSLILSNLTISINIILY